MKRILLSGLLAIVMTGCQKKASTIENNDSISTDSAGGVNSAKKVKPQTLASPITQSDYIPIDKNSVDNEWYVANKAFVAAESTGRYMVNPGLIGDATAIGTWMGLYDDKIAFTDLYPIIEAHHEIKPINTADYAAVTAVPAENYKVITWANLRTKLENAGIGTDNQYDYCFKVTVSSTGINVAKNRYEFADAVYSVPMINAILTDNNLTNPSFSFASATIDGATRTFFKVTASGFTRYYDMSHKPVIK